MLQENTFFYCVLLIRIVKLNELFLWNKKERKISKTFRKILNESSKIWLYEGSEFYKRSMKSWLEHNNNEYKSIHNKGKSVITERFVRNPNNKIYKYMISLLNLVYIDKLSEIVKQYNNTIKRKLGDVEADTCINFPIESNVKKPKFNIFNQVQMSKYKKIFLKGYNKIGQKKG